MLAICKRAMYGFVDGGVVRAWVGAALRRLRSAAESGCGHGRRVDAIVAEHLLLDLGISVSRLS